jgi:hypothetical protein
VDNHEQADTYLQEGWQKYRSKYGPSRECGDNTADASFLSTRHDQQANHSRRRQFLGRGGHPGEGGSTTVALWPARK